MSSFDSDQSAFGQNQSGQGQNQSSFGQGNLNLMQAGQFHAVRPSSQGMVGGNVNTEDFMMEDFSSQPEQTNFMNGTATGGNPFMAPQDFGTTNTQTFDMMSSGSFGDENFGSSSFGDNLFSENIFDTQPNGFLTSNMSDQVFNQPSNNSFNTAFGSNVSSSLLPSNFSNNFGGNFRGTPNFGVSQTMQRGGPPFDAFQPLGGFARTQGYQPAYGTAFGAANQSPMTSSMLQSSVQAFNNQTFLDPRFGALNHNYNHNQMTRNVSVPPNKISVLQNGQGIPQDKDMHTISGSVQYAATPFQIASTNTSNGQVGSAVGASEGVAAQNKRGLGQGAGNSGSKPKRSKAATTTTTTPRRRNTETRVARARRALAEKASQGILPTRSGKRTSNAAQNATGAHLEPQGAYGSPERIDQVVKLPWKPHSETLEDLDAEASWDYRRERYWTVYESAVKEYSKANVHRSPSTANGSHWQRAFDAAWERAWCQREEDVVFESLMQAAFGNNFAGACDLASIQKLRAKAAEVSRQLQIARSSTASADAKHKAVRDSVFDSIMAEANSAGIDLDQGSHQRITQYAKDMADAVTFMDGEKARIMETRLHAMAATGTQMHTKLQLEIKLNAEKEAKKLAEATHPILKKSSSIDLDAILDAASQQVAEDQRKPLAPGVHRTISPPVPNNSVSRGGSTAPVMSGASSLATKSNVNHPVQTSTNFSANPFTNSAGTSANNSAVNSAVNPSVNPPANAPTNPSANSINNPPANSVNNPPANPTVNSTSSSAGSSAVNQAAPPTGANSASNNSVFGGLNGLDSVVKIMHDNKPPSKRARASRGRKAAKKPVTQNNNSTTTQQTQAGQGPQQSVQGTAAVNTYHIDLTTEDAPDDELTDDDAENDGHSPFIPVTSAPNQPVVATRSPTPANNSIDDIFSPTIQPASSPYSPIVNTLENASANDATNNATLDNDPFNNPFGDESFLTQDDVSSDIFGTMLEHAEAAAATNNGPPEFKVGDKLYLTSDPGHLEWVRVLKDNGNTVWNNPSDGLDMFPELESDIDEMVARGELFLVRGPNTDSETVVPGDEGASDDDDFWATLEDKWDQY